MKARRFQLSCPQVMGRSYLILAGLALTSVLAPFVAGDVAIGGFSIAVVPACLFLVWFLAMLGLPVRVVVGDDGLYAYYGFARYYVPLSSITDVSRPTFDTEVRVLRSNANPVCFTGTMAEGERFMVATNRVLATKKWASTPEVVFARHGRSFREWADGARALVDETRGSYREAQVPRERALKHLQDPALAPELRIGAALALAANATNEEKDAIERAIAGVASPTLKRVLTSATTGKLDVAEAAQAEFEEEAATANKAGA